MRTLLTALGMALTTALLAQPASAQSTTVVPGDFANTAGASIFVGPHAIGARRYQMLMHEDLLTDLVGRDLTGVTFRSPSSVSSDWPDADVTYPDYEIYLGPSVAPADRSTTFADNLAGPLTQVRDGPHTVPAGSFVAGGDPNPFGHVTEFSPYTYTGGHLLLEIRHVGNGDSSRSIDAINTNDPNYDVLFGGVWSSDLTDTEGFNARFGVLQFTSIPAPSAFAMLAMAAVFGRRRRRAYARHRQD